jgi:probable rRNA maturation factor
MINITNKTSRQIDTDSLKQTISSFFKYYNIPDKNVSIALVGDEEIKRVNNKFLGRDGTTDVIAFPGKKKDLGEIIIDYDRIERQAEDEGNSVEYELKFVLVHGLLHLLGWEDYTPEEKERMLEEGEKFLDNC